MRRFFYRRVRLAICTDNTTDSVDLGDHEEIVWEGLRDEDGLTVEVLIRVPQRPES
jgi:hypothetical protein